MNITESADISEDVRKIQQDAVEVFDYLYDNPEISSEEINSSKFIMNKIRENGLEVEENFLNMRTSFISKHGKSPPSICIFAEYDALPIGHACGHNIIASWAVGTFLSLTKSEKFTGTVYLVGSPAEEGRGEYASSKVRIVPYLEKLGIDAVFAIHPGDRWKVSGNYYARWRKSFQFVGKESHAAGAPEKGINALDAAVSFYSAVKALRNQLSPDEIVIISEIIKEGGVAVNIVPGKATVWVDVRTVSSDYIDSVGSKIDNLAEGIATANSCGLLKETLAPNTLSFKRNPELDVLMFDAAKTVIPELEELEKNKERPIGSSDIGNVSQVVPTTQLIVKVAEEGTPLHSESFLKASGTDLARLSMIKAVEATYTAVIKYFEMKSAKA